MDPIQAATPVNKNDEKLSRPWLRAILSSAVFGTIGAAAMNWLGYHGLPIAERAKPSFGRNWMTLIGGVASGTVAFYGTMHAEDAPPRNVKALVDTNAPAATISADSVELESTVLSPVERSL